MEYDEFLLPVSYEIQEWAKALPEHLVGHEVQFYLPNKIHATDLFLISLAAYDAPIYDAHHNEVLEGLDQIRKCFYTYQNSNWHYKLYDLGTLYAGDSLTENHFALHQLAKHILAAGGRVLCIGADQSYTVPLYKALDKMFVNFTSVDYAIDILPTQEELSPINYLTPIITDPQNRLLEYVNLGSQAPYVAKSMLDMLDHLNFDNIRLGKLTQTLQWAEPAFRMADMISIDTNAIQYADFQSGTRPIPNGFNAREICAISRYAGMSEQAKIMHIAEFIPGDRLLSMELIAQMIWYYIESINSSPAKGEENIYRVLLEDHEMVFIQEKNSEKWWIEITVDNYKKKVPCTEIEYHAALRGEIPDRWWRFFKKFY